MTSSLELGVISIGLAGGLALFLYGMRKMTEALKIIAGERMKQWLSRFTTNRVSGATTGALITAVIQSSSITTVLVVGFVTAGLMTFKQSIGVILGSNVGTTMTAQIIAFKVTESAMIMIAMGFFIELLARNERLRHFGILVMGLGLLFLGMNMMSQATEPLRSYQPFIALMQEMQVPLFGIFIGAVFTAIVQSSSATTGIVIVLATQGYLTLESGIALVLGANVGTCITALLSAIGKPREALQTALAHVTFNVLGAALWVGFIPELADLVRWLSPQSTELDEMARLATDSPRQIANAHTLFNVVNLLLFISFTGTLARLVVWIAPDKPITVIPQAEPQYIDAFYLDQPALALDRVQLELGRLGDLALGMVKDSLSALTTGTRERIQSLQNRDDDVDSLHGEIITYLSKLSLQQLIKPQPKRLYVYIAIANYLENVGDVVETSLAADSHQRVLKNLFISPATSAVLKSLHDELCQAGELSLEALADTDYDKAQEVVNSKEPFNRLLDQTREHLTRRLTADAPDRLATYRIETNIIENFKRIHSLFIRIAELVIDEGTPEEAENHETVSEEEAQEEKQVNETSDA